MAVVHNLGSVYRYNDDLTMELAAHHQKLKDLIQQRQTKANLVELSEEFTKIFYPHGKDGAYTELILDALARDYLDTVDGKIKKFLETPNTKSINRKFVSRDKLWGSVTLIQEELKKLRYTPSKLTFQQVSDITKRVKSIKRHCVDFSATLFNESKYLNLLVSKEKDNINFLLDLVGVLSQSSSIKALGDVFEDSLTSLMSDCEEGVINKLEEKIISATKMGNKSANRNWGQAAKSVPYTYIEQKDGTNIVIQVTYNPFVAKMGKMDVLMTYGDNEEQLRLSAKTWGDGSGNLGDTTIEAGMMRTSGQSIADLYKLTVLNPKKEEPHEYAPYAIKADIAMGLSQPTHWANILIVDDRAQRKIRFIDLASIVSSAKLTGYNAQIIKSVAQESIKAINNYKIRSPGRTNYYLGLMHNHLKQMEASINFNSRISI